MATAKKTPLLELSKLLIELDSANKSYYNSLSPEEKKAYVPLVLMRYMSSLGSQSPYSAYAVLAVNDLVNVGFWQLNKHPELQHMLLCLTGIGSKQYRPWIPQKSKKSSTNAIDLFFKELYEGINEDELYILKHSYDKNTFKSLAMSAGKTDKEVKLLMDEWKKLKIDD